MRFMLIMLYLAVLPIANSAAQEKESTATISKQHYFVAQYSTGSGWDTAKQPHEQKFFKEHSQLLGRLRKKGTIVIGARYSDKGFIVVRAHSEEKARALFANDPSVKAATFQFELFPLSVFYGGCVEK